MLTIIVTVLIAIFVALIASAYYYESKLQKAEKKTAQTAASVHSLVTLSVEIAESNGYARGYVDGCSDTKKQYAVLMNNTDLFH